MDPRTCRVCSSVFTPAHHKTTECSEPCKQEHRRRYLAARSLKPRAERPVSDRREYYNRYNAARREANRALNQQILKCDTCGYLAARIPSIGCLECYARTQPRGRKWSPDEEHEVEIYAGAEEHPRLQMRIYTKTKSARTRSAILNQVFKMGIRILDHQDGYTVSQLSKITGRPRSTIAKLIVTGVIQNIGTENRIVISPDDGQKVINRYSKFHKPSYSIAEVTKILGYSKNSILKAIHCYGLPSWKHGRSRRVCKVTVDRAVEHLRKTGNIRIRWRRLVRDAG